MAPGGGGSHSHRFSCACLEECRERAYRGASGCLVRAAARVQSIGEAMPGASRVQAGSVGVLPSGLLGCPLALRPSEPRRSSTSTNWRSHRRDPKECSHAPATCRGRGSGPGAFRCPRCVWEDPCESLGGRGAGHGVCTAPATHRFGFARNRNAARRRESAPGAAESGDGVAVRAEGCGRLDADVEAGGPRAEEAFRFRAKPKSSRFPPSQACTCRTQACQTRAATRVWLSGER